MTLRAVAWSAARTCTIAVKFTLTAGSMPIVAILVIFWTMSARRCASRKGCRAQEGAGPVRRLISNRSRLRAPHIGGCANPIDTGWGKVPTPNWGMCTKSGGRHQHNRRTQFSGCPNC
jgi:hypothetical protein